MTGTDFEGIDLDRLADYVSGALDGTPDAAAVADLVATDPRWTRAHAALVAADALVRADLAELAAQPEPMPDDVMARLDAVFAAEPPLADAVPGKKPPLTVLPGGRSTAVPTVARRRWRSVVGVAAAIVILGVGAITLAPRLSEHSNSTASRSDTGSAVSQGRVPSATAPKSASGLESGTSGAPGINASGSNYTDETLSALHDAQPLPRLQVQRQHPVGRHRCRAAIDEPLPVGGRRRSGSDHTLLLARLGSMAHAGRGNMLRGRRRRAGCLALVRPV